MRPGPFSSRRAAADTVVLHFRLLRMLRGERMKVKRRSELSA